MKELITALMLFFAISTITFGQNTLSDASKQLMEATKKGKLSIIKESINNGANVNAQDAHKRTSLHYICGVTNAHLDVAKKIAELLLNNGAKVNTQDNDGNTPLHRAIIDNRLSVANLLLARGANPLIKNKKGETAADLADDENKYYSIQEMLKNSILMFSAKDKKSKNAQSHKKESEKTAPGSDQQSNPNETKEGTSGLLKTNTRSIYKGISSDHAKVIPVAVCCTADTKEEENAGITLTSILENAVKDGQYAYDFYIFYEGNIHEIDIAKWKELEFAFRRSAQFNITFVSTKNLIDFSGIEVEHRGELSFYHLAFPQMELFQKFEKVVYLDSGILVYELPELWRHRMVLNNGAEAFMIGVRDPSQLDSPKDFSKKRKGLDIELGLSKDNYINSGVLVLNIKRLQEFDSLKKNMDFIREHKPHIPDQDAINFVLKDKIKVLDHSFNWPGEWAYKSPENGHTENYNIQLLHYFSEPMPWNWALPEDKNKIKDLSEYHKYKEISPWAHSIDFKNKNTDSKSFEEESKHIENLIQTDTRPIYQGIQPGHPNVIPVTLCCNNENYAIYAGVTITSILENTLSDGKYAYDFHIIYEGNIHQIDISKWKELQAIFGKSVQFNITFVDGSELIDSEGIDTKHWGKTVLYRLAFSQMAIFQKFEKMVYLDCDVIVNDLPALWEIPMRLNDGAEAYIIAARDPVQLATQEEFSEKMNGLDLKFELPKDRYINAGILVLNLKRLQNFDFLKKGLDFIREHKPNFLDQDAINFLLKDKIKMLDFSFNWPADWASKYPENEDLNQKDYTIQLIQYYTAKPWHLSLPKDQSKIKNLSEYHKYRELSPWAYTTHPEERIKQTQIRLAYEGIRANKEIIPVVLCANEGYFPQAAATIGNILENATNQKYAYDFYIVYDGDIQAIDTSIWNQFENSKFIEFNITFVDGTGLINPAGLNLQKWPISAMYRLALGQMELFQKFKKVVYLDCDVVAYDMLALWEQPMTVTDGSEAHIIGMRDPIQKATNRKFSDQVQGLDRALGLEKEEYINSGILVLNIEKLKEFKFFRQTMSFIRKYQPKYPDQDAISFIAKGKIKVLEFSFNWPSDWDKKDYKIQFMQFMGEPKPWPQKILVFLKKAIEKLSDYHKGQEAGPYKKAVPEPVAYLISDIPAEHPSEKIIRVLFSTDNNYLIHTGVSITSILCNSRPSYAYDIYVAYYGNITDEEINQWLSLQDLAQKQNTILNLTFIMMDKSVIEISDKHTKKWGPAALARMIISELDIFDSIEKILYLDGDVIIYNLYPFWSQDFKMKNKEDAWLVAIKDKCQEDGTECKTMVNYINAWSAKNKNKECDKRRDERCIWLSNQAKKIVERFEAKNYISSGALLINLNALRDNNFAIHSLDILQSGEGRFELPDQDAINIAAYGKIKVVDYSYAYPETEGFVPKDGVPKRKHMVHYTGLFEDKPWNWVWPKDAARFKKSPHYHIHRQKSIWAYSEAPWEYSEEL
jgi:lipopolysaccharide biosynthesis glycosyltransferase